MRFWLREIAGCFLVLLGLFFFWCCLAMLLTERPQYIQAGPLTLIGIIVFRGGIHLLKVAVAARIVLAAERQARRQETPRSVATPQVDPIAQNW